MKFIAIDLGQKTGYAVFDGLSYVKSGKILLPKSLKDQYKKLKALVQQHGVDLIAYEMTDWHRPSGPKEAFGARLAREKINRQVQRALGRKEAFCEAIAFELGIDSKPVPVHAAKKSITGNGNASKSVVAGSVKSKFGEIINENATQDEIDAFSVASVVLNELDPLWAMKFADKNIDNTY